MNFWSWINENHEYVGDRSGYWKRIVAGAVIFIIIPILIYFVVIWNPVIGTDEDGEPVKLGFYLVFALYWFALYIDYKRYEAKKRLKQLLDKLFEGEDAQFERINDLIKNKRKIIQDETVADYGNEGEERLKWFGIK